MFLDGPDLKFRAFDSIKRVRGGHEEEELGDRNQNMQGSDSEREMSASEVSPIISSWSTWFENNSYNHRSWIHH